MPRFLRHLPNALTVGRLCALPAVVLLYGRDAPDASWPAAIVLLAAALTDVADGRLARTFDVESEFGRWVDPVVDRVFFFTVVTMLWCYGTLPWLAAAPLLVRDGIILTLALPMRVWTTERPDISPWGRAANLLLVCALEGFVLDLRPAAWVCFAAGAGLYIASGLLYGYRAIMWLQRPAND